MWYTLVIGLACLIGGIVYAIAENKRKYYNNNAFIGGAAAVLGGIAVLVGGIGLADRAGQRADCHNFGRGTGLSVKFQTYAGGWAYTCFAKVNGKWLPKEQIRGFQN